MRWQDAVSARPLVGMALAAVAGIVTAGQLPSSQEALAAWAILAAAPLGWILVGGGKGWLHLWLPLLLATSSVFGFLHTSRLLQSRDHPLRQFLERRDPAQGLTVTATGRVEKALRRQLPGNLPREELFVAEEVYAPTTGQRWRGRTVLRLQTGREDENLPPGRYRMTGFLRLPRAADNPGQFDERSYDLRLGLVAELRAIRMESLSEDRWNVEAVLIQIAEACRKWINEALARGLEDAPARYAVIQAMVLGTADSSDPNLKTPFMLSGTLHIFSVSGLHVAIVGLILWKFLKSLGLARNALLGILIPVLFGYAFVTGLPPSAVRAALMASVFLCGALFHRKSDLLNSLAATALLLLAYDTLQLQAPGFQLSFTVLAAIALLARPFSRPLERWAEPDPFLPRPLLSVWQRFTWNRRRDGISLFAVSAAAWLGSLPLGLVHFQLATPVALVSNMVLVPLSFCVLFTALVTLLSALCHLTFLQILFSNANWLIAGLAMSSAQFFASVPGGHLYVPADPWSRKAPVELTVLRLPEGAAAQHLRAGDRHWMLDVGREDHFRYLVQPYFLHRGVNSLSGMILSHGDIEHVGGAAALLERYGLEGYYQSSREPWRWEGSNSSFKRLRTLPWTANSLSLGRRLLLGRSPEGVEAEAEVLYPPETVWPRRADDRSLVVRLHLGRFRVLWCGDAGFVTEKTLLEMLRPDQLRADVLLRNHHASDHSFLPDFVAAVQPRVVVSSNQSFPAGQEMPPQVGELCRARGIVLLDQSQSGAVRLKVWPDRLEVEPFREPRQMTLLRAEADAK